MEMRRYRKILRISYKDHVPNEKIHAKIQQAIEPREGLLTRPLVLSCARHSERGKKTRQTEEEVGRKHQGKNRPGVCEVQESSGEKWRIATHLH